MHDAIIYKIYSNFGLLYYRKFCSINKKFCGIINNLNYLPLLKNRDKYLLFIKAIVNNKYEYLERLKNLIEIKKIETYISELNIKNEEMYYFLFDKCGLDSAANNFGLLKSACQNNFYNIVKMLLEKIYIIIKNGYEFSQIILNFSTSLRIVCNKGFVDILKIFYEEKFKNLIPSAYGYEIIYTLYSLQDTQEIERRKDMLNFLFDLYDIRNYSSEQSYIIESIREPELCIFLLEKFRDNPTLDDTFWKSLLIYHIPHSDFRFLKLLWNNELFKGRLYKHGNDLLFRILEFKNLEIFKFLVEEVGINPNILFQNSVPIYNYSPEILEVLIKNDKIHNNIIMTNDAIDQINYLFNNYIFNNNLEIIKLLYSHEKFAKNLTIDRKRFETIIEYGSIQIIKFLFEKMSKKQQYHLLMMRNIRKIKYIL